MTGYEARVLRRCRDTPRRFVTENCTVAKMRVHWSHRDRRPGYCPGRTGSQPRFGRLDPLVRYELMPVLRSGLRDRANHPVRHIPRGDHLLVNAVASGACAIDFAKRPAAGKSAAASLNNWFCGRSSSIADDRETIKRSRRRQRFLPRPGRLRPDVLYLTWLKIANIDRVQFY